MYNNCLGIIFCLFYQNDLWDKLSLLKTLTLALIRNDNNKSDYPHMEMAARGITFKFWTYHSPWTLRIWVVAWYHRQLYTLSTAELWCHTPTTHLCCDNKKSSESLLFNRASIYPLSNNASFWKSQTNSVNDSIYDFDWVILEIPIKNYQAFKSCIS